MTIAAFRRHGRATWLLIAAFVISIGSAQDARAKVIRLEFQIHPKLAGNQCSRLPTATEVPEEEDFPKLLFISEMSSCPQYPFYSGADYELQTAIFEYAARSSDAIAYRRLLAKDGRSCPSEMNPPLFAILRKNQQAFLSAFASLESKQQQIAAATHYDFNLSVEEQQFDVDHLRGLSPQSAAAAQRFNEFLASQAKDR